MYSIPSFVIIIKDGIPKEEFTIINQTLKENICIAEYKSQYDQYAKRLLSNRYILAWILKYTAEEFKELDIHYIANTCIEGSPNISSVAVMAPSKPSSESIFGNNTEHNIPNEGTVYFDILFHAVVPRHNGAIKLLINIEAQKNYYPGYEIMTRGIFYGARMLSSQYGSEFTAPHYEQLKKVYSIWICMDVPNYIKSSISLCHIKPDILVGYMPAPPHAYDLLSVVKICLNEKTEEEHSLLALLKTLFSASLTADHKIDLLSRKYGIFTNPEEEKELITMCNLSEAIEEKGIQYGIQRGLEQGIRIFIEYAAETGGQKEYILAQLAKRFELSDASAMEYFEKFATPSKKA